MNVMKWMRQVLFHLKQAATGGKIVDMTGVQYVVCGCDTHDDNKTQK